MAKNRSGLGKGLSALIADASVESGTSAAQEELELDLIAPNPNQPRKDFDPIELNDLAESIKREGLLQPILVRPTSDGYQIIAGERRWQASKIAGLVSVPVKIVEMDDERALRVALIENLQRSDLNAMEEARGFKDLMEEGNLTQVELAEAVSKSRSAVANSLRLLDLPEEVQKLIFDGQLTAGHARAVLSVSEKSQRIQLANTIVEKNLSVREAENYARLLASGKEEKKKRAPTPRSYKIIARELRKELDTQVKVKSSSGKNRIEIEFQDENDLERIFNIIRE